MASLSWGRRGSPPCSLSALPSLDVNAVVVVSLDPRDDNSSGGRSISPLTLKNTQKTALNVPYGELNGAHLDTGAVHVRAALASVIKVGELDDSKAPTPTRNTPVHPTAMKTEENSGENQTGSVQDSSVIPTPEAGADKANVGVSSVVPTDTVKCSARNKNRNAVNYTYEPANNAYEPAICDKELTQTSLKKKAKKSASSDQLTAAEDVAKKASAAAKKQQKQKQSLLDWPTKYNEKLKERFAELEKDGWALASKVCLRSSVTKRRLVMFLVTC